MTAIITISVPLDLMTEIERVRKKKDMSRSATVAYLVSKGLEYEGRSPS